MKRCICISFKGSVDAKEQQTCPAYIQQKEFKITQLNTYITCIQTIDQRDEIKYFKEQQQILSEHPNQT